MMQSEINPSISSDLVYNVQSSIIESANAESDANNFSHNLTPTTEKEQDNKIDKEVLELSTNQEPISMINTNVKPKENLMFQTQVINELPLDPDVALAQQLGITSSEQLPLKQDLANEPEENNFTEMNIVSTTPVKDLVVDNLPKVHPKLQVIKNLVDVGDNEQVSKEDTRNALSELNMMDTDFDENLDFGSSKDNVKSMTYREPNLRVAALHHSWTSATSGLRGLFLITCRQNFLRGLFLITCRQNFFVCEAPSGARPSAVADVADA
ncbi:hypothetical protein EVAR_19099_1 [Eumeta japonica]|uniref:Uncharacterized protein n=1 Tax=Eumeta variegata TaxID=151549 RepID=A0A4C1UPV8_EUMVA|nr:hypothetical protein EVAR_19099_1 [Eumeta japonica]